MKVVVTTQILRPGLAALLTACLLIAACDQASPTQPVATGTPPPGPVLASPSEGAAATLPPPRSAVASSPGASSSPTARPDGAATTSAPVGASAPADAGPDGLRVVESGFTAFFGDGNDFASFAAVIDNPNRQWAVFQMQITIDFFDSDDNFIAGEEQFVQVLPGQRTAIAGEAFGAGRAARMTVTIPDDTSAYERYNEPSDLFRVTGAETSRGDGLNITRGRITSRAAGTQSLVQLTAVYRNGRAAIIGGTVGGVDTIAPGATIPFEVIDGAPFAAIADTEVYWQVSGVRR